MYTARNNYAHLCDVAKSAANYRCERCGRKAGEILPVDPDLPAHVRVLHEGGQVCLFLHFLNGNHEDWCLLNVQVCCMACLKAAQSRKAHQSVRLSDLQDRSQTKENTKSRKAETKIQREKRLTKAEKLQAQGLKQETLL